MPGWVLRLGTGSKDAGYGWEAEGNRGCFSATDDISWGHLSPPHFLRSLLLSCCGGFLCLGFCPRPSHPQSPIQPVHSLPKRSPVRAWSEASAEPHGRSCASGKGAGSQLTSSPDTKALCSFQSGGESFLARSVCICVIGPASASRSPLCAGRPPRETPGPSLP